MWTQNLYGKREKFKNELKNMKNELIDVFPTDIDYSAEDVDQMVKQFTHVIYKLSEPLFGKTFHISNDIKPNNCQPAWMTERCLELRTNYFHFLNVYMSLNTDESRINMVSARSKYTLMVRKAKIDFDREYTNRSTKNMNKNPQEFWKLLKTHKSNRTLNTQLAPSDCFQYFRKISNPNDINYVVDEDIYEYMRMYETGVFSIQYNELNNIISDSEVELSIKQLKRGKAAGCDHLINELYIYGCDQLIPKLSALFNVVFKSSHFPRLWQEGIIVPIHKKGSVDNVQNYRGITLLSTLGKLFTRIINNRLNYWSDTYHIINDNQSGFRQGMSTVDNIYIYYNLSLM